ncbi:hypothetical protein Q8A67_019810 [Cirrhinus molitorella]|uniref:Uncharacterized protein n=1 Tax=Cirrhinus molitorella TaxID=172907 RepID=A0AA88PEU1_9TELE|nr:hypothetical protein Q8A67_019810 [Cirrhinus molitorella]
MCLMTEAQRELFCSVWLSPASHSSLEDPSPPAGLPPTLAADHNRWRKPASSAQAGRGERSRRVWTERKASRYLCWTATTTPSLLKQRTQNSLICNRASVAPPLGNECEKIDTGLVEPAVSAPLGSPAPVSAAPGVFADGVSLSSPLPGGASSLRLSSLNLNRTARGYVWLLRLQHSPLFPL